MFATPDLMLRDSVIGCAKHLYKFKQYGNSLDALKQCQLQEEKIVKLLTIIG